jgi:hypothetical protein
VPAHLLILGERSGLAWVPKHEQMAFADHRRAAAIRVAGGHTRLTAERARPPDRIADPVAY